MRGLLTVLVAASAGIAAGAAAHAAYQRHKQRQVEIAPLDPTEVILSAAGVVDETSDVSAKVHALRVYGYPFCYDPEDYDIKDIDLAWLQHMEACTLIPGNPRRTVLVETITKIGMTPRSD